MINENQFLKNYRESRTQTQPVAPVQQSPMQAPMQGVVKEDKYAEGVKKARELGYSDIEIDTFLKKQGKFSPSLNQVEQGGASGLSNFIGATKLGQFIGQNLYKGSQASKGLDSTISNMQMTMSNLDQQMAKNAAVGRDNSRLQQAKLQLQADMEQAVYTQSRLQGGTSGREAFGSAIQTVASAVPFTGLVGRGVTAMGAPKVGALLTGISKGSGIATNAAEGALGGAVYGLGSAIEQEKGVGGTLGDVALTGAGGAVLGPIAGGVFKGVGKLANKLSPESVKVASEFLGQDLKQLQTKILQQVSNSADSGFTKNTNLLKKEFYGVKGDPTASPLYQGVESVYLRSKDPIQVPTYDKKTKTITTKNYDPMTDGPLEASDAIGQIRAAAFSERAKGLDVFGPEAFAQQKAKLISDLRAKQSSYLSQQEKSAMETYIKDIEQNITQPSQLDTYNQRTLGTRTKSKMGSNADNISAEIAQDAKKISESNIEQFIGNFQGADELNALKKEIEHLTAIQNLVNESVVKLDPSVSLKDLNLYGISNMIAGGFFGNPAQFAKGTAFTGLSKVLGKENPFDNFKGAIKSMDELYTKTGQARESKKLDLDKLKAEYEQLYGIKLLEAPMPGAPRKSEFNNRPIPVAPKNSAIDITAPQGVGNFDINSLNPEQRGQLEQEVIKAIEKITGQKKNLNNEGGFINPLVATVLGALGLGTVSAVNALKEVSSAETPETKQETKTDMKTDAKTNLRKGFTHVENRGAVASGEDVYKVKGVTGDLGKYQVKPQTLKEWSGPWLGKTYSPEEFLKDPEAQEKFMDEFLAVVDSYKLTPEEAAIIWHKGWGVLGDQKPRAEKEKALRKHIESKRDEASEYVKTFKEGLNQ